MNDIMSLFEGHSSKRGCEMTKHFSEIKGSGSRAAARILYMRLVQYSTNSKKEQKWILKPASLTKTIDIENWLKDETTVGMSSSDLLIYFKASTYKDVLNFFINIGLISIDKFNRMYLHYPFGGKMLSLQYAAVAIKSSYKKKSNLDTTGKDSVVSPAGKIPAEPHDSSYWED